jgi:aspartyl protease family protein
VNIRLRHVAFWLLVGAVAYLGFDTLLAPKVTRARVIEGSGVVTIMRSYDQHFYVEGSINGHPVTFMVDTGATAVSVGEPLARKIGLPQGMTADFGTAGGRVTGRIVSDATVQVGGIRVSGIRIGVHPDLRYALLGQNFLNKLDLTQDADRMVLRARKNPG